MMNFICFKGRKWQVILASEGYTPKAACLNGIESVKKNSQDDARFDKLESKNGKPYFNLKATNGQIIGNSEMWLLSLSGARRKRTKTPDNFLSRY
jgi:uncharacterized protein YegP (UPF0339 family)